jgi:hypothetical protein
MGRTDLIRSQYKEYKKSPKNHFILLLLQWYISFYYCTYNQFHNHEQAASDYVFTIIKKIYHSAN